MTVVLVLTVPTSEVELAADALWRLGVRAIEERRLQVETDPRHHIDGGTDGLCELWTHVGDMADAAQRATAHLGGRWPLRWEPVPDAPSDAWRDHVGVLRIDDSFVVVPAWIDVHAPGAAAAHAADIVVAIEPGGAFGMGDHPTTRLCLRALRRLIAAGDCRDVLDVGCGTGVIAVAAAVLTGRRVRAIDVSSAAVEATNDNALRNAVGPLVDADEAPLAEVPGAYDIVFANILAPTLVELADDLRRVTRAGGRLVISGVLDGRHDHVLAALEPFAVERTDVDAGWAAITLRA